MKPQDPAGLEKLHRLVWLGVVAVSVDSGQWPGPSEEAVAMDSRWAIWSSLQNDAGRVGKGFRPERAPQRRAAPLLRGSPAWGAGGLSPELGSCSAQVLGPEPSPPPSSVHKAHCSAPALP